MVQVSFLIVNVIVEAQPRQNEEVYGFSWLFNLPRDGRRYSISLHIIMQMELHGTKIVCTNLILYNSGG